MKKCTRVVSISLTALALSTWMLGSQSAFAQSTARQKNPIQHMHPLDADEIAIQQDNRGFEKSASKEKLSKISLNGQTTGIQKGQNITGITGSAKTKVLVSTDNIATSIVGPTNQPLASGQIVQPSVQDQINKNGEARVILLTKTRGHYFDAKQNYSERNVKRADFQATKFSIAAVMSKKSRITKDLQVINGFAATIDNETLQALKKHPKIAEIQIDGIVHTSLDTSTQQMGATGVWSMTDTSAESVLGNSVTIAIIDTGVDYLHPDLGGCFGSTCKVIGGYDYYNYDADPMDDNGHGTHVAATAAGIGAYPGVAPNAKILAYKVLNADGYGYDSNIIQGIQAAMDPNGDGDTSDHADIISMSLGSSYGYAWDSKSQAVDNATAVGVVSAVAAGNNGPYGSIGSPGTAATAITVAAACKPDQVGSDAYCATQIASFSSRGPVFSQYGEDLHKPDVAAPGVLICAARMGSAFPDAPMCLDTHHVRISGTSMATPHVAGSIALLKQTQPWLTPEEIKQVLKTTAVTYNLDANVQGAGIMNAESAVLASGAFVPKLSIQSDYWALVTDPTNQTSVHNQSFNVSGVSVGATTLTAQLSAPINGVTFSAPSIAISNGSTSVLNAVITVDNDVAVSGVYSRDILLKNSSNVLQGSIHVNINITPTLSVNSTLIDYGYNDPSASTWTSGVQSIQVTNLRTDISQTILLSTIDFPAGTSVDAPASFTLPAGGGTTINSQLVVPNNLANANGIYFGSVRLSAGSNIVLDTAAKFVKGYVVEIVSDTYVPAYIVLSDNVGSSYNISPTSTKTVVYVSNPGTYDLIVVYSSNSETPTFVTRESVPVVGGGGNTINIAKTDAIYTFDNVMTASDETTYYPVESYTVVSNKTTGIGIFSSSAFQQNQARSKFSPMSTNYSVERSYDAYIFGNNMNLFYDHSDGVSSNKTFTNLSSDLQGPVVQTRFNMANQTNLLGVFNQTVTPLGFMESVPLGRNTTLNLKSMYPNTWTKENHYNRGVVAVRSDADRLACPPSGPCNKIFETPLFFPNASSLDQNFSYYFYRQTDLNPRRSDNVVTVGQGPMVWYGQFFNDPYNIAFNDFSYLGIPFKRQDYSIGEYEDITFNVYDSSNKNVIGTGIIPGYNHGVADYDTLVGYPNNMGITYYGLPNPGKYGFSAMVPYWINQGKFYGVVTASFNTKNTLDPNPPSLRKMYVFDETNLRTEVLHKNKTSAIEFEVDPVLGTLDTAQTTMTYKYNNGAKGNVTLSSWDSTFGKTFHGTIPGNLTATKVTIRIKSKDAAKNVFSYQFDLPVQ